MKTENRLLPQEDALALLHCATSITQARQTNDLGALTIALDENMQLWTAIQTLVSRKENTLDDKIKENLIKLSNFVVSKTISMGCDAAPETLDTLENMNIQIAQGLLENLAPVA